MYQIMVVFIILFQACQVARSWKLSLGLERNSQFEEKLQVIVQLEGLFLLLTCSTSCQEKAQSNLA